MKSSNQNITGDREPIAAGKFYPADTEQLKNNLSRLFAGSKKNTQSHTVRALISPHAGFNFSGKIAASAYSTLIRDKYYKNIFIIGSSHIMAFEGASVYDRGDFITPLGKVTVNREIGNILHSSSVFEYDVKAHLQEHSLELQLPFLQFYLTNLPPVVPVIIGTNNKLIIKEISNVLQPWFTAENLFIISSDFSHYPSYKDAREVDRITAAGLLSGDPDLFLRTLQQNTEKDYPGLLTSMCGWTSGLLLLYLAEGNKHLDFVHIDYCNSGDSAYAGREEVVGYHAIALVEKA